MLRRVLVSAVLAGVLVSGVSGSEKSIDVQVGDGENNKAIEVVGNKTNSSNIQVVKPSGNFIKYARAVKKQYRVMKPITVKLRLNRDAYIYFIAISQDSGKGYLILPNDFDSYNKYKANVDYVIPHRTASFDYVSDRVGVEQVYVIATSIAISKNRLMGVFSKKASGVIPMASRKSINNFVSKDIIVRAKRRELEYDIAKFGVNVVGKATSNRVNSIGTQNINIHINR